jgi:hypothetical protein
VGYAGDDDKKQEKIVIGYWLLVVGCWLLVLDFEFQLETVEL